MSTSQYDRATMSTAVVAVPSSRNGMRNTVVRRTLDRTMTAVDEARVVAPYVSQSNWCAGAADRSVFRAERRDLPPVVSSYYEPGEHGRFRGRDGAFAGRELQGGRRRRTHRATRTLRRAR